MQWSLFAIMQMFVIATAVGVAFWLRNRQLADQNEILRAHLDNLQEGAGDQPSAEEWVTSRIEALTDEHPNAPLLRLVLEHQLQAKDGFEQLLIQTVKDCGLGGESAQDSQQVAELEQALAEARDELQNLQTDNPENQAEELKSLLQQYTQDSREMMLCIQTLEKENAELKTQLQNPTPTETAVSEDPPPAEAGEPSARDKEPSARDKEPSAQDKEPTAEDQEPSAQDQEPSAQQKEPSAQTSQESSDQHQTPTTAASEPATSAA